MPSKFLAILSALLLAGCAGAPQPDSPADFTILSRADWKALPPVAPMNLQQPTRITVHHTAVKQYPQRSLPDKLQALQKFSQNPGTLGSGAAKPAWPDVPYHYYIDCRGQVGEGREVKFVGDTNTNYDPAGHALVVLEGNFEEETPTPAQLIALRKMIAWLAARYQVPPDRVGGHSDFAETLCPGRRLHDLLPELRAAAGGR